MLIYDRKGCRAELIRLQPKSRSLLESLNGFAERQLFKFCRTFRQYLLREHSIP